MCPTGKMSINDLSKQGYLMFAVSPVLNLSEQGCELSVSSSRSQGFFLNLQEKSPENEVACYLLRNMKGCASGFALTKRLRTIGKMAYYAII